MLSPHRTTRPSRSLLTRIAAALAAPALVIGVAACGDDAATDSDTPPEGVEETGPGAGGADNNRETEGDQTGTEADQLIDDEEGEGVGAGEGG